MQKRPLILLSAAVAFAAVVLLLERPERPRVDDGRGGFLVPDFDSGKVERVEIEQLMDGAELKREGDRWLVAERIPPLKQEYLAKEGRAAPEQRWHLADHARVSGALGVFSGLEEGVLVSDNEGKRQLYQVDAAGLSVRGFDAGGKNLFDIVIGKGGPDFTSTHVRRSKEHTVLLINRPLVGVFTPRASDWRERKLWAFDPAEITLVEVTAKKKSWKMVREEAGAWKLTAPQPVPLEDAKARSVVEEISQASAADFADEVDAKAAGIDEPETVLTVEAGGGKSVRLLIGGEDDRHRRYGKLEGSPDIVLLSPDWIKAVPLKWGAPKK